MSFELATRIKVVNPSSNIDELYGPYDSLSIAYSKIPKSLRKGGRTFGIFENNKVTEYWWESDALTKDGDEVVKNSSLLPNIGSNGNWYIDGQDTGVSAKGEDGEKGDSPYIADGEWWVGDLNTGIEARGPQGKSAYEIWKELPGNSNKDEFEFIDSLKGDKGEDGSDVTIDPDTKTWVIDGIDSGVKATGDDGITPRIQGGRWWIGNTNTGVRAAAIDGETPYIQNNYWWIRDENTGVRARGEDGRSALEIWRDYTGRPGGTEEEFLHELQGRKGDKGDKGDTGARGPRGYPGEIGPPGESSTSSYARYGASTINPDIKYPSLATFENLIFSNNMDGVYVGRQQNNTRIQILNRGYYEIVVNMINDSSEILTTTNVLSINLNSDPSDSFPHHSNTIAFQNIPTGGGNSVSSGVVHLENFDYITVTYQSFSQVHKLELSIKRLN